MLGTEGLNMLKIGTGLLLVIAAERVTCALGISLGPVEVWPWWWFLAADWPACTACIGAASLAGTWLDLASCSCRRLLFSSGKIVPCLSMSRFLVDSTNLLTRSGLEPLSLALGSALYSLDFNSASVFWSSQDRKELMSPKK